MAVDNVVTITYGGFAVGGASDTYQLHDPLSCVHSFEAIEFVFDVMVVASSYSQLVSLSTALEAAYSSRLDHNETFVVDVNGSSTQLVHGTNALNTQANAVKSGDPETDKAHSRRYTVTVTAELPAIDTDRQGLRDLTAQVTLTPSRQHIVEFSGTFTLESGVDAKTLYEATIDAQAGAYLTSLDATATWELVAETFNLDRQRLADNLTPNTHVLPFTRRYVQLLTNQTIAALDDAQIRDHRVTFADTASYPGDAAEDIYRMQGVIAGYECAVDITETTDVQAVYAQRVRPYLRQVFENTFLPQQYAIEDEQVNYNETSKRLAVSLRITYQPGEASDIVLVTQSVTTTENRSLVETPVHAENELGYYVDVGFATRERTWTRTVARLADPEQAASAPVGSAGSGSGSSSSPGGGSPVGIGGGSGIGSTPGPGWNEVGRRSTVTPQYIGQPGEQIQITLATDTRIERFYEQPGSGGSGGLPRFVFPPV